MCTCSMRIACKPGSEVPEHLNLSRTPAPFLSARLPSGRRTYPLFEGASNLLNTSVSMSLIKDTSSAVMTNSRSIIHITARSNRS